MLGMMSDLLDGLIPSIQDILFVQSAVLESLDIYKPMDVAKQLLDGNLDVSRNPTLNLRKPIPETSLHHIQSQRKHQHQI